jgi:hypothetical protein
MSNLYWKNLLNVSSDDSEVLKDYKDLCDKINDYFESSSALTEFSKSVTEDPMPSKQPQRTQKKTMTSPKVLETSEKKKSIQMLTRATTKITEAPSAKRAHVRSNTLNRSNMPAIPPKQRPRFENYIVRSKDI